MARVRDPDDPASGIVIPVEAQRAPDTKKRYRIPVCQAILADKHGLPTWPVVVSLEDRTTALLREWAVGPPPKVDALVLARDNVPRVTTLEQARQRPTLTALSAALHGYVGDLECVRVAVSAFRELKEDVRRRYTIPVVAALSEEQLELVKGEIMTDEELRMELERDASFYEFEMNSGFMAWLRQMTEEKGRIKGRKATLVEMIIAILEVRGVPIDASTSTRIRNCNLTELERLSRRAREVTLASQLFTPP